MIWITLTPESAVLSSYTMDDMSKAVKVVRGHASAAWGYDYLKINSICLGKYDLALDAYGSFIP